VYLLGTAELLDEQRLIYLIWRNSNGAMKTEATKTRDTTITARLTSRRHLSMSAFRDCAAASAAKTGEKGQERQEAGRFREAAEVKHLMRDRAAPGRELGHVDG
jgi:hypothetical protein